MQTGYPVIIVVVVEIVETQEVISLEKEMKSVR